MRGAPKPSLLSMLLGRWRGQPKGVPETGALRPFQAISIYRGVQACAMAKKFSEHRFLARDAPPLPLTGCTLRGSCQCKYLKHKDRRAGPRRLLDFGLAPRLFDGREQRQRIGRRTSD